MSRTPSAERKSSPLSRRLLLSLAPVALFATGAGVVGGAMARTPEDRIAPGVQVAGIDLSGKTLPEARVQLETLAKERKATTLTLKMPEEAKYTKTWKPNAAKIGLSVDVDGTLDAANRAGRLNIFGKVQNLFSGAKPVLVAVQTEVDENRLRGYLKNQVAKDANRKPKNAKLIFLEEGGFGYGREKPGLSVDVEASSERVAAHWKQVHAVKPTEVASEKTAPTPTETPLEDDPEVELVTKVEPAKITYDGLKQINGTLASFGTYYTGSSNRGGNIALATRHINGTMLAPGEVFSYNKIVGPRSSRAGFRMAPVIVRGELVPGIGGGICQVSSTLYNAVLLADLKIVDRAHHAFPVHYLPAGRDATVVDGAIDFKFKNSTDAPLYIRASAGGGRINFQILGKKRPGKTVGIITSGKRYSGGGSTRTVRDPGLPAGKRVVKSKGHTGVRVSVYRVVKQDGEVVKRELIAHDYYRPQGAIVAIGSGRSRSRPTNMAGGGGADSPAPSEEPTPEGSTE